MSKDFSVDTSEETDFTPSRQAVRKILLDAWAEFVPADERESIMDYWVWEWISQEWPAEDVRDESKVLPKGRSTDTGAWTIGVRK